METWSDVFRAYRKNPKKVREVLGVCRHNCISRDEVKYHLIDQVFPNNFYDEHEGMCTFLLPFSLVGMFAAIGFGNSAADHSPGVLGSICQVGTYFSIPGVPVVLYCLAKSLMTGPGKLDSVTPYDTLKKRAEENIRLKESNLARLAVA